MKEFPPQSNLNLGGMPIPVLDGARMSVDPAPKASPMKDSVRAEMGSVGAALLAGLRGTEVNASKILTEKLNERLAFERLSIYLYDAMATKLELAAEAPGCPHASELRRIRGDEARHVDVVLRAMESLGVRHCATTPEVDLAGIESLGLVQAIGDPRTTLTQALHALLIAELTDQVGWEVLIALALENRQPAMADEFAVALDEERQHLRLAQKWFQEALLDHPLPDCDTGCAQPMRH